MSSSSKKPSISKRMAARLAAVQLLFQWEYKLSEEELGNVAERLKLAKELEKELILALNLRNSMSGKTLSQIDNLEMAALIQERLETYDWLILPLHQPLFSQILIGVASDPEIDDILSSGLPEQWPLSYLDPVVRALLRAAVFELLESRDVPRNVILSQYVSLMHLFSVKREPAFVNGVLEDIAATLRPPEVEEDMFPVGEKEENTSHFTPELETNSTTSQPLEEK